MLTTTHSPHPLDLQDIIQKLNNIETINIGIDNKKSRRKTFGI